MNSQTWVANLLQSSISSKMPLLSSLLSLKICRRTSAIFILKHGAIPVAIDCFWQVWFFRSVSSVPTPVLFSSLQSGFLRILLFNWFMLTSSRPSASLFFFLSCQHSSLLCMPFALYSNSIQSTYMIVFLLLCYLIFPRKPAN